MIHENAFEPFAHRDPKFRRAVMLFFPLQTAGTVPLLKNKLFISISCPILVLTTVMGRPRRADVEKDVKNYQGPKKALLSRF